MDTKADIERVVRAAYAARKRNDLDACLKLFADRPVFRIAGAHVTSPIALASRGQYELRVTLAKLIKAFEWIDHTIVLLVIEGSTAAVYGRVKLEANATGDVVDTEMADFFEIKDGRIVSLTEFCDTALAARLLG